jgi:hypothetical protein
MALLHQVMNAVKIKSGIKKGEGRDLGIMREENVREGKTISLSFYSTVTKLTVFMKSR